MNFFATCPKGLELLLEQELQTLGALDIKQTLAGVYFTGELEVGYRACLWSRLANRILLPLGRFSANNAQALYEATRSIDWLEHMAADASLLVNFNGTSSTIINSHFGALKVKDAIVDYIRDKTGQRPSIDKDNPHIRINAHLHHDHITLSLDLSGDSLHKRGYRERSGIAPIKENVAAAILMRAGWLDIAKRNGALLDPLCGSGTFLIEAGLLAADIAPGLLHAQFGFKHWRCHQPAIWTALWQEAISRREQGLQQDLPEIRGYDADPRAIVAARDNIIAAGLDDYISVTVRELANFTKPTHTKLMPGLIVTNPPYGERLSNEDSLVHLYQHLGERLREQFHDWQAAVITGNPELGKKMGIRAEKQYAFFNGALPCKLLLFTINEHWFVKERVIVTEKIPTVENTEITEVTLTTGGTMFANRLMKNKRIIGKWARKNAIDCYRIYDADMPEYAVAIDLYHDWAHVQEYAPPSTIDPFKAEQRLRDIVQAIPQVLNILPQHVIVKQRRKQSPTEQYTKHAQQQRFVEVKEYSARLLINLTDYLDTGLFLDHRPVRRLIYEKAKKKSFLNLFCYTATATVQAALGGAWNSTSVDMSHTYINWAKRNFAINGLSETLHRLIQDDCIQWLDSNKQKFDLILLDPPTFSNSKRMHTTLDIQRDHVQLIRKVMRHLSPTGTLIFSNNYRQFKMDKEGLAEFSITDITKATLDKDFLANPRIHNCWEIQYKTL